MSIRDRVARYQEQLAASSATLVAVTKGVEAGRIMEAIDAGVRHIGENRVQEVLSKYEAVNAYAHSRRLNLTWHMIGHLQTNKVRAAVKMFDVIQSVDSVRLALEVNKQAAGIGKVQDVLLEVNVSGEASKYGFSPEEVRPAFSEIAAFENIRVLGAMTVAPVVSDSEQARLYFRKLKELGDDFFVHRPVYSMGMTDDYEIALQEGATMVRIGRGIFGER